MHTTQVQRVSFGASQCLLVIPVCFSTQYGGICSFHFEILLCLTESVIVEKQCIPSKYHNTLRGKDDKELKFTNSSKLHQENYCFSTCDFLLCGLIWRN